MQKILLTLKGTNMITSLFPWEYFSAGLFILVLRYIIVDQVLITL